ncbi:flagellar hook-length control protein FliK [Noviherbaspirillum humi]|uniref:Flagellar hook-length control protein FliK n=1 Tax=Noviherbaspirillum humi TaxID=1688639 RepID=A0A239FYR4_9BURK|nr:flagellar hook-length control protein FliK [Noviherbaspirillum humi]SNS61422.1 flagellar hook-length control protein FliK [Noviherbaspirillum humi]
MRTASTQVLNTLLNGTAPAASPKPNESAAPVTPFSTFLSRESAGRSMPEMPAPAAAPARSESPKPAQKQAQKQVQPEKPRAAEAKTPEKTESAQAPDAPADKTAGKAEASSAKEADADEGDQSATPAAESAQSPQDMLALMMDAGQFARAAQTVQAPGAAEGMKQPGAEALAEGGVTEQPERAGRVALRHPLEAAAGKHVIDDGDTGGKTLPGAAADKAGLAGTAAAQNNVLPDLGAALKEPALAADQAAEFAAKLNDALPAAAQSAQALRQAAPAAFAAGGVNSDTLAPKVGTPAWDAALGQKVVWMVAGEEQSASLTLNPPDLGPLQVVLNVSNSQATATFVSDQAQVREAIEAAMPKLREMLGDAGIQLGQASVNAGTPGQQHAFAQTGEGSRRTPAAGQDAGERIAEGEVRTGRARTGAGGNGLVDTFA